MNKSKIEWCNMTWNPVTGCLHGCDYCYARKIATRFSSKEFKEHKNFYRDDCKITLDIPITEGGKIQPFPGGFLPTFHKYRLDEPQQVKKSQKIFVCSMADLFGDWIPDEWIRKVMDACAKADHHKYIFLTKNPKSYNEIYRNELDFRCNMWLGTTVTDEDSFINRGCDLFQNTGLNTRYKAKRFLSIEPLLGSINESILRQCLHHVDWIIIGAQTGPGAKPPKTEWVQSIIDQARAAGISVFLKSNLKWHEKIQEFPKGLEEQP